MKKPIKPIKPIKPKRPLEPKEVNTVEFFSIPYTLQHLKHKMERDGCTEKEIVEKFIKVIYDCELNQDMKCFRNCFGKKNICDCYDYRDTYLDLNFIGDDYIQPDVKFEIIEDCFEKADLYFEKCFEKYYDCDIWVGLNDYRSTLRLSDLIDHLPKGIDPENALIDIYSHRDEFSLTAKCSVKDEQYYEKLKTYELQMIEYKKKYEKYLVENKNLKIKMKKYKEDNKIFNSLMKEKIDEMKRSGI